MMTRKLLVISSVSFCLELPSLQSLGTKIYISSVAHMYICAFPYIFLIPYMIIQQQTGFFFEIFLIKHFNSSNSKTTRSYYFECIYTFDQTETTRESSFSTDYHTVVNSKICIAVFLLGIKLCKLPHIQLNTY